MYYGKCTGVDPLLALEINVAGSFYTAIENRSEISGFQKDTITKTRSTLVDGFR